LHDLGRKCYRKFTVEVFALKNGEILKVNHTISTKRRKKKKKKQHPCNHEYMIALGSLCVYSCKPTYPPSQMVDYRDPMIQHSRILAIVLTTFSGSICFA
jgi:hypothetical protein